MLVIGLTGGIGTGKSEVARILGELGAEVIDADKVGHQVYAPHTEAWREVVEAFGRQVLKPSEEVDREKLGAIVFGQPEKMARLNAITHPVIAERIRRRIGELERRGVRVAVVEAALLTATPLAGLADEVWVTDAPQEQVVERLAGRSHLSPEEVRRRISMQEPFSEMAKSAQVVVENRGSLDELREKVRALWERRVSERTG